MNQSESNQDTNLGKFRTPKGTLDWKKIGLILIVLCVVGYNWYTENVLAPKPGEDTAVLDSDSNESVSTHSRDSSSDPISSEKSAKSDGTSRANGSASASYLLPAGGKNLRSPAGLLYTSGKEHRATHVLRHDEDIPDRREPHGVFDADGDDIFRLIDEAYELIKTKSKRVDRQQGDNGKTVYVIEMNRKIGFLGGQPGKRKRHPTLDRLKLVLAENRVITAYPY